MSVDVSELNSLAVDLARVPSRVQQKAPLVVRKVAADIERDAKLFAPIDTGFLRNSIGVDRPGPLEAVIGPTAEYAPYLEFGTSRMAPPPWPSVRRRFSPACGSSAPWRRPWSAPARPRPPA